MKNFRMILLVVLVGNVLLTQSVRPQDGALLRAIVFTTSGIGVSGYLVGLRIGVEDDTLVLTSTKGTERFTVGSLTKVIILPVEHQGNLFLAGSIIGTYASTLLIGHTEQLPTGYLEESFAGGPGLILTTLMGVLIGGGVGVLINSGSSNEIILEFTSSAGEKKSARKTLYELFSKELTYRKFHIIVQGGHVYTHVKDEFQKYTGQDRNGLYGGEPSNFTLLRKIQVTYSRDRDVEIGAAIQWSSEPKVSMTKYTSTYDYSINNVYNYTEEMTGYEQVFDVTGYYAIGKYKPFVEQLPRSLDIAFGGGVGIAAVSYHRSVGITTNVGSNNYTTNQYTRTSTERRVNNDVNKSVGSAIVFTEASYNIHDYFSVGLTMDYSYFPSIVIPPDAGFGLPEQTLTGNGCFGLVLGIHL